MEKDQIIILKDRGLISISGKDAKEFLQNIISNDINKVDVNKSIFSALLTPQGKYLFEFFIIKSKEGYFIDCEGNLSEAVLDNFQKYKLRSKVILRDISSDYVVGILNLKKFEEIQQEVNNSSSSIIYRDSPLFIDPRENKLGARILSPLDKLYLTIKKLNLNIIDVSQYYLRAFELGIPTKGLENLREQLFGLEANFENLNAIDFKKGCYVGQENTARMKLKNKVRRKLMPIKTDKILFKDEEIKFKEIKIGKVLIDQPHPFGLIKIYDPDYKDFKDKEIIVNKKKCKV